MLSVSKCYAWHNPLYLPLCHRQCIHLGGGRCPCLAAIGPYKDHILIENIPLNLHACLVASLDVVYFAEGSSPQYSAYLDLWYKVSISHYCLAKMDVLLYLLNDCSIDGDCGLVSVVVQHPLRLPQVYMLRPTGLLKL